MGVITWAYMGSAIIGARAKECDVMPLLLMRDSLEEWPSKAERIVIKGRYGSYV